MKPSVASHVTSLNCLLWEVKELTRRQPSLAVTTLVSICHWLWVWVREDTWFGMYHLYQAPLGRPVSSKADKNKLIFEKKIIYYYILGLVECSGSLLISPSASQVHV